MAGTIQYELYNTRLSLDEAGDAEPLPWDDEQAASQRTQPVGFAVREEDGTVWARLTEEGQLQRVERPNEADVALRVLRRRLSSDLAVLTHRTGVLVNGLPALRFSLLGTKDSLRLAPGRLFYVTERIKPYVGPATEELIGKKCPFCRMPITAETHVVTCRCGAVYHHETADSHPDLAEEDRLGCFQKVQNCLACGNRLTTDEYLVWEPEV